MLELSLSQRFAVIGAMPSRAIRHADGPLFDALAAALARVPALSLVASVEQAFAGLDIAITAREAAPIARAIAVAEDTRAPLLATVIARACADARIPALA